MAAVLRFGANPSLAAAIFAAFVVGDGVVVSVARVGALTSAASRPTPIAIRRARWE